MKFNVGDKVTFINEKQEGVVKDNLGNLIVRVEIEDGFEIDIHESELAIIYGRHDQLVEQRETERLLEVEPVIAERYKLPQTDFGAVYWIAMPADEESMLSGPVSFIVKNDLANDVLLIVYVKKGDNYDELFSGKIEAGRESFVIAKRRNEIKEWEGFRFELSVLNPALSVDKSRSRLDTKVLLPDLDPSGGNQIDPSDFARVTTLHDTKKDPSLDLEKLKQKFEGTLAGNPVLETFVPEPDRDDHIREVDLHIEKIVPNPEHFNSAAKLEEQVKHFRQEMNNAVMSGVTTMIFIHGLGNGILKNRLINEIEKYETFEYRDAPENTYGQGAIMVDLS